MQGATTVSHRMWPRLRRDLGWRQRDKLARIPMGCRASRFSRPGFPAPGSRLLGMSGQRLESWAHGGVSRVHLVFTPPRNRKQGFASACVAAITTRELANPGRLCMLYTDVENPTSNKIYQEVGYHRVGDTVQSRFPQRSQ